MNRLESYGLLHKLKAVREKITGAPSVQLVDTPTNPCEIHWSTSFKIDPDGLVYKYPAVAGRPEMAAECENAEALLA